VSGDARPATATCPRGPEWPVAGAVAESLASLTDAIHALERGETSAQRLAALVDELWGALAAREPVLEAARGSAAESEQRLADIINFLPDATLVIDQEGTVIAWNRAMEELTGIPAAAMLGQGDHAYSVPFYGERRPVLVDFVLAPSEEWGARYPGLVREGASVSTETFATHLPRGGAHLFVKASPLRDPKGRVTGAIEIVRDITAGKRAEESRLETEQRLSDIIDFLPDATVVVDRQ